MFALPSGSEGLNLRLFSTDLRPPPPQDDLKVTLEPILSLNNSRVGITITTSRMTGPHFMYHYFPAGGYTYEKINLYRSNIKNNIV